MTRLVHLLDSIPVWPKGKHILTRRLPLVGIDPPVEMSMVSGIAQWSDDEIVQCEAGILEGVAKGLPRDEVRK